MRENIRKKVASPEEKAAVAEAANEMEQRTLRQIEHDDVEGDSAVMFDDSGHKDSILGIGEVDSALTNNEVVEGGFKFAIPVDQPSERGPSLIDDSSVGPTRVDPIMEKIEFVYDKNAFAEIEVEFAETNSTVFTVDVSDESIEVLMDDDGVGFDG